MANIIAFDPFSSSQINNTLINDLLEFDLDVNYNGPLIWLAPSFVEDESLMPNNWDRSDHRRKFCI